MEKIIKHKICVDEPGCSCEDCDFNETIRKIKLENKKEHYKCSLKVVNEIYKNKVKQK